jgi:diguanylate cyclase (GGDEF)-like protein
LYNWDFFEKKLELVFLEERKDINLIFFDLNDLKKVNDNFWHQNWDDLLKEFAKNLNLIFWEGKNDIFRIHWDEFTILSSEKIELINKKILQLTKWLKNRKFQIIHEWKNKFINISFAYWISDINEAKTPEQLYKLADTRMYIDKKEKKWN